MALDYDLYIEGSYNPELVKQLWGVNGTAVKSKDIVGLPGVESSTIVDLTARPRRISIEPFAEFYCLTLASFTIDPACQDGRGLVGIQTAIHCVCTLFRNTKDRMVFVSNGSTVLLVRQGQIITINSNWSGWSADRLSLLDVPYASQPLEW